MDMYNTCRGKLGTSGNRVISITRSSDLSPWLDASPIQVQLPLNISGWRGFSEMGVGGSGNETNEETRRFGTCYWWSGSRP